MAANLASLGGQTRWVSVLPEDGEGDLIWERLQGLGVDLCVSRAAGRIGYYWHEPGTPPRPDYVPVRRASLLGSAVDPLDWAEILRGYEVFHCSGITAGLGENARREICSAFEECRRQGVRISYDLNYRSNLWTLDEARVQLEWLNQVDTLFAGPADLETFFDGAEPTTVLEKLGLRQLVMGYRRQSAYRVILYYREGVWESGFVPYQMVDRIGVGDAMVAGFWAGGVEWAAWSAALKYSLRGDMARLSPAELKRAIAGGEILR